MSQWRLKVRCPSVPVGSAFPRDVHVGLHHPQGKRGEEQKMLRHQRSRAYCVSEPDHETDPGGCRNHPLLRWREQFRQQHARCESSFLPIQAGASLNQKEEEHRSIGMEILYTNCAGLDVHKILPNAPFGLSRKNVCYSE